MVISTSVMPPFASIAKQSDSVPSINPSVEPWLVTLPYSKLSQNRTVSAVWVVAV